VPRTRRVWGTRFCSKDPTGLRHSPCVTTGHAAKPVQAFALSKFAAVRAGASAEQDYLGLLDACETLALAVRMSSLMDGANMARHEAYRHLVARGFRTEIQGVTMHRHNDPGYCRPGVYIIDDWQQHSVGSLPIREWLRASFSLPCGGIIETRHPRFCGKSRPAGVLLVQFVGDAFVVEAIETFLSDLLV
jgi:hypothetical protein